MSAAWASVKLSGTRRKLERYSLCCTRIVLKKSAFPLMSTFRTTNSQWPRCDFRLSNFKAATFVQVSKQASSEFQFVGEIASDLYQPIFFGIDPHLTLHFMEHMGLGRWRLETRVWSEV